MTLREALSGVSRLFLDTAPVIYYVEENPLYLPVVNVVFEQIANGTLIGVTSPVTLAECLVMPYRLNNENAQRQFVKLIVEAENINFAALNDEAGRQAAELRARYNLQLADALQMATAFVEGCEAFLTNDADLRRVSELTVLVVGELEV